MDEVGSADMLSDDCEDLRAATSLGSIKGLRLCMMLVGVVFAERDGFGVVAGIASPT
jgi:hypothetical protein